MRACIKSSTPLRAISISLLSIFVFACSSDGDSGPPATVVPAETTQGLTTATTGGLTTGTGGLTTGTGGLTGGTTGDLTTGTGGLTGGTTGELTTGTGGLTGGTTGELTTGTGGLTGGTSGTTGELTGGTSVSQLSCDGERIWGPIPGDNVLFYISEAAGFIDGTGSACAILWLYDPTQNCSLVGPTPEGTIAEITANGGLAFQFPETQSVELPAADISINVLATAPDCPDDGGGTGTDGGTTGGGTTGGTTGGTGGGTPLACSGDRVWGPVNGENPSELIYITEASGGDVPQCALLWIVDTAQNCRDTFTVGDNDFANVSAGGSLAFQNGDNLLDIGVAGVSFDDLINIAECP